MTPRERIKSMVHCTGLPHICGWTQVREHLYVVSRMLHFVENEGGVCEMPMESWRLAPHVSSYLGGGDVETLLRVMCAMGVASRRKNGREFVYRLSADMTAPDTTCRAGIFSEFYIVDSRIERQRQPSPPERLRISKYAYHIIAVGLACGRYETHRAVPATPIGVRLAQ